MRSLMAGMTDYSHQSLDDMRKDLEDWVILLTETLTLINSKLKKLEDSTYWENYDFDFKSILYSTRKMFNTAIIEIDEVLKGFEFQILEYHVKMVEKIGRNGEEYYRLYGKVWHNDEVKKDYGTEGFRLIESLYEEGRGTSANLIDLQNLANRLKDFVGRKGENFMDNNGTHFHGPVGAVQQNYGNSSGTQNIGNNTQSSIEGLEELKVLIGEIHEALTILPKREREQVQENLTDLSDSITEPNPKPHRIKAFANSIADTFKKTVNMKTLDNTVQVTEKLPKIIEGIEKITNAI